MLKIKDNVDLKELEKFGFVKNISDQYVFSREINGTDFYLIYITTTHHYVQIKMYCDGTVAGTLQTLIYDLIKADMVEKSDKDVG